METIEAISTEVMTIPDQAKMIVIRDQMSMTRGNEFFLVIKGLRRKIADTMDPIISAAFLTHKTAVGKKKELEAPLILAENWINGQMTAYKLEQDRIRREEEDRLRQEAIRAEMERRKKEEERRLAEAAALEAAGAKEEAAQVMEEIIQETEAPVIVSPPPPIMPKVEVKGAALRETWTFEVINETLIPRQYLVADMVKIGGIVRALKDKANIPGIRVYSTSKMAATGR